MLSIAVSILVGTVAGVAGTIYVQRLQSQLTGLERQLRKVEVRDGLRLHHRQQLQDQVTELKRKLKGYRVKAAVPMTQLPRSLPPLPQPRRKPRPPIVPVAVRVAAHIRCNSYTHTPWVMVEEALEQYNDFAIPIAGSEIGSQVPPTATDFVLCQEVQSRVATFAETQERIAQDEWLAGMLHYLAANLPDASVHMYTYDVPGIVLQVSDAGTGYLVYSVQLDKGKELGRYFNPPPSYVYAIVCPQPLGTSTDRARYIEQLLHIETPLHYESVLDRMAVANAVGLELPQAQES